MFTLCDSSIPQESPRWLLSVGREEDARKALKKMAAINGKELPADLNLEENKAKVGRKLILLFLDSYVVIVLLLCPINYIG